MEKKSGTKFLCVNIETMIVQRRGMTMAARDAYTELMLHACHMGGELPDDDELWQRLVGCSPSTWKKVKPQILPLMVKTETGWTFPFAAASQKRFEKYSEAATNRNASKSLKNNVVDFKTYPKPAEDLGGVKSIEDRGSSSEYEDRAILVTTTSRKETVLPAAPVKEYFFESGVIKLNEKDFKHWQRCFPKLNLMAELEALRGWEALTPSSWFHAVPKYLKKQNEKLEASGGKKYFSV